MKKTKIFIPIFNVDLYLLIGNKCSIAQYIQDSHAKVMEIAATYTAGECVYSLEDDAEEFLYIALYEDFDYTNSISLIHEVLHAAFKICKFRGVTLDEEILCYLQGFILEKIFKCLNVELTVVTNHQPTQVDEP